MSRHLLIAAGGTGGHMFPAQSLAEEMLTRGWRVTLSTDDRGARYAGNFPEEVERRVVASATFARGGIAEKLMAPFRIGSGVLTAISNFRQEPPDAVVGFGGYPSIPAMSAATFLKIPRMIHEQNGVLGRVNQLFATRVDAIACGTWPTELPEGVEGLDIGNPVRAAILARQGAPYVPPGDWPLQILVMGGSQGARILSDVVPAGIASLPEVIRKHIRVSHQAREEDVARVEAAYAEAGIPADVQTFFHDVPDRMSEAQLVITRSGASTVADLSVIGRPSILVPLAAAIRDEQTANARGLVDKGAAILMPEARFTPEALAENIALVFENPEAATKMANAAMMSGKLDAARDLANVVEALAQNQ